MQLQQNHQTWGLYYKNGTAKHDPKLLRVLETEVFFQSEVILPGALRLGQPYVLWFSNSGGFAATTYVFIYQARAQGSWEARSERKLTLQSLDILENHPQGTGIKTTTYNFVKSSFSNNRNVT